jgi:hypothetical protein
MFDLDSWLETYEVFLDESGADTDVESICGAMADWEEMDSFARIDTFRDQLNSTLANHGYAPVNVAPDPFLGMSGLGASWVYDTRTVLVNEPNLDEMVDPTVAVRIAHHEALHVMGADDAGHDVNESDEEHEAIRAIAEEAANAFMEECLAIVYPPESGAGDDFPDGSPPGDWVVPPDDTSYA